MRTINKSDIGENRVFLLDEEHPIDEDIGILDEKGIVSGVVITKDSYDFFLRKVEEEEDKIDNKTVEEFNKSGGERPMKNDIMEDLKDSQVDN